MKAFLFVSMLWAGSLQAQTLLKPIDLFITTHKTTHIVFSSPIISADRGSQAILIQKVQAAENLLQIKAAQAHFEPTNLTVLTADGCLHSFDIHFQDHPQKLMIPIGDSIAIQWSGINKFQVQKLARQLAWQKGDLGRPRQQKNGQRLRLTGLYQSKKVLYVKLEWSPETALGPCQLHYWARRSSRKTIAQHLSVLALVPPELHRLTARKACGVLAFERSQIPSDEPLRLEVQVGNQNFELSLSRKRLLKARLVTEG